MPKKNKELDRLKSKLRDLQFEADGAWGELSRNEDIRLDKELRAIADSYEMQIASLQSQIDMIEENF